LSGERKWEGFSPVYSFSPAGINQTLLELPGIDVLPSEHREAGLSIGNGVATSNPSLIARGLEFFGIGYQIYKDRTVPGVRQPVDFFGSALRLLNVLSLLDGSRAIACDIDSPILLKCLELSGLLSPVSFDPDIERQILNGTTPGPIRAKCEPLIKSFLISVFLGIDARVRIAPSRGRPSCFTDLLRSLADSKCGTFREQIASVLSDPDSIGRLPPHLSQLYAPYFIALAVYGNEAAVEFSDETWSSKFGAEWDEEPES
jgi:hypothetical protein